MKQHIRISYFFFLLFLQFLIPSCFSSPTPAPKPKPKPVFEPLIEYGGKGLQAISKSVHPIMVPLSKQAGSVYGQLSLYSADLTEWIMEKSVKVAVADPKLTAPLANEIGKAGALAFIGNKKEGMLIVKACNEGVWEILSAAMKEFFVDLASRIKYLAISFKDSAFSKIPGISKFVSAAPFPPPQVAVSEAGQSVAEAGLATTNPFSSGIAQRTWAQYFSETYKQAGEEVAQLKAKVGQLTDQGFQFTFKVSAQVATGTPEFIKDFGESSTTYAKKFVENPDKQARVAREFGRVAAREFLKNPKAASAVIYEVSKGAVPILYKEYTTIFSKFVTDLGRFVAAVPSKAMVSLKALAEKILADMKALMPQSKQIGAAASTVTKASVDEGVKIPGSEISKVKDAATRLRQKRDGSSSFSTPPSSLLTDQEMQRIESLTVDNDPFIREMHATILQFQKLGHLIYFKSQATYSNLPLTASSS